MLTFEQIKELIDQVAAHRLSGLELERSGFRLKIDGHRIVQPEPGTIHLSAPAVAEDHAAPTTGAVTAAVAPAEAAAAAVEASEPESLPANAHVLTSPIVGTFYRAPNPDSAPYVEVGDRVKKGQVLCIVEAMKLMNEIESDADGTVIEVYAENAQPVEFGERLFAIQQG